MLLLRQRRRLGERTDGRTGGRADSRGGLRGLGEIYRLQLCDTHAGLASSKGEQNIRNKSSNFGSTMLFVRPSSFFLGSFSMQILVPESGRLMRHVNLEYSTFRSSPDRLVVN